MIFVRPYVIFFSNVKRSYSFQTLRAYEEYLIDVAKLLGATEDVEKQANETVQFEKELAKVSLVIFKNILKGNSSFTF